MKSKFTLLFTVLSLLTALSLLITVASAAPGDNLWISDTAWGQLIDSTGAPVYAKGNQISVPVTLTSSQGTILVTTPGSGTTNDEKSMPELDGVTGLYKNVVYIDTVSAPTGGSVQNYSFGFDPALVTKGQTLYVKVGGTDLPAGDHQKAATTYLGAAKPEGAYTAAVDSNDNLVITTPSTTLAVPSSASWSNPKVSLTISTSVQKEITAGITATDTTITVPNSALASAFSGLTEITVTNIGISDNVIEDTALNNQSLTVNLDSGTPAAPNVTANDAANTITGLDLAAMEYAISYNDGQTYQPYSSSALSASDLAGYKTVKVRIKPQAEIPASEDTILIFTPNPGDVSGDGLIDISDVIATAEIAVGNDYDDGHITIPEHPTLPAGRADVNGDSVIDISDVVLIAERVVGPHKPFPVEQ